MGTVFVGVLALYAACGIAVAFAFAVFGAQRALDPPASFTPGARILLIPGAILLWPCVVIRWLAAGQRT